MFVDAPCVVRVKKKIKRGGGGGGEEVKGEGLGNSVTIGKGSVYGLGVRVSGLGFRHRGRGRRNVWTPLPL